MMNDLGRKWMMMMMKWVAKMMMMKRGVRVIFTLLTGL
jgi:hypothetical protein